MQFEPPLIPVKLIKRYKRFLADVYPKDLSGIPESSDIQTVHCPNTGSMKNCWDEGWHIYLHDSQNPKRKYSHTWTLSENQHGHLIGVNTHLANKLVQEALENNLIKEVGPFDALKAEVPYGNENSRIDFYLSYNDSPDKNGSEAIETFIEVKSVTLLDEVQNNDSGCGYFPDAVSTRGQKHLRELIELTQQPNKKAVLLFCVQHTGINKVKPADHIDPKYGELLREAKQAGVLILAYKASISPERIELAHAIPVEID